MRHGTHGVSLPAPLCCVVPPLAPVYRLACTRKPCLAVMHGLTKKGRCIKRQVPLFDPCEKKDDYRDLLI